MNTTARVLIRIAAIVVALPIALFALLTFIAASSGEGVARSLTFAVGATLLATAAVTLAWINTRKPRNTV